MKTENGIRRKKEEEEARIFRENKQEGVIRVLERRKENGEVYFILIYFVFSESVE